MMPKISAKFQWATNGGGVGPNQWFLIKISLYLRRGARWGYSYYGRLIRTRMRSIKWRYFQWSWLTPNHPIFHILYPFHIVVVGLDRDLKLGRQVLAHGLTNHNWKARGQGRVTHFKFCAPVISLEWLKLKSSNLAHRLY